MKITFDSKVTLVLFVLSIFGLFFIQKDLSESNSIFVLNGVARFEEVTWYISLLTYIFGHADWGHVVGNMSIILLLGPLVEMKFGWQKTALMIAITAVLTGILHVLLWDYALCGSSGIAFMMIVLVSLINSRGKEIPITFLLVIAIYFGQEIIASLQEDRISQFAHLFGGAMGAFWGFYKWK